MTIVEPKIKRLNLDDGEHELLPKYIQDNDGNYKTWQDILDLVDAGFTIEVPWTQADYISSTAPSASKLATIPAGVEVQYNNGASTATGTLVASATTKNTLYFLYCNHGGKDTFDEYATVKVGNDYSWEKIGNTDIDLSAYALKGTYTTDASSGDTGSAGAETITVSITGEYATGSTVVNYDKATDTNEAGGQTVNTTEDGSDTVPGSSFTFNGTKVTVTPTVKIDKHTISAHSHTVNIASTTATFVTGVANGGTVEVVTGVGADGTATVATEGVVDVELTGDKTFVKSALKSAKIDVKTATTTNYEAFVSAISAPVLTGDTASLIKSVQTSGSQTVVSNITTTPTSVFNGATVDANGVLSFLTASVVESVSKETATLPTGITTTTATLGVTATVTTKYIGVTSTLCGDGDKGTVGITFTNASTTSALTGVKATGKATVIKNTGLATATINNVTGATLDTNGGVTLEHTQVATSATLYNTLNGGKVEFTPAGTIGGSYTIPAHSHSVTIAGHTHSVNSTPTSLTVSIQVPIDHSHTINVSNHVHSLNNHTHNITIVTPNA